MITAIVLINAEVDRIPEVAQAIAELDGVSEVYSVTGDADLIAMVRVKGHEDLADVIADRISKVDGILGTATHIAAEGHGRLGAPQGELPQSRPAAPGEHQCQGILGEAADISCGIVIDHTGFIDL